MEYRIYTIDTLTSDPRQGSVLVVYTGGTIGMDYDPVSDSLIPYDFNLILDNVPELKSFEVKITVMAFERPIDSSNMHPDTWVALAKLLFQEMDHYSGFVVLHGTDTMCYTASAISFFLENLKKPVIFTGAQLPIGSRRSDARENFITAIEMALATENNRSIVTEVTILFDNKLFRANRTRKVESNLFDAFQSDNYPLLAEAGVRIRYYQDRILKPDWDMPVKLNVKYDASVGLIKIFPGLQEDLIDAVFSLEAQKLVIIEAYGSGNVPASGWFREKVDGLILRNKIVLVISQCAGGTVQLGKYATSRQLLEAGAVGGKDLTTEAAITKSMMLLGIYSDATIIKQLISKNIRGEMSD